MTLVVDISKFMTSQQ